MGICTYSNLGEYLVILTHTSFERTIQQKKMNMQAKAWWYLFIIVAPIFISKVFIISSKQNNLNVICSGVVQEN